MYLCIMIKGDFVERIGSQKDYCTGRKGKIVEDEIDGRFRVLWIEERSGKKINVRTWVNKKSLRLWIQQQQ